MYLLHYVDASFFPLTTCFGGLARKEKKRGAWRCGDKKAGYVNVLENFVQQYV